MFGSNCFFLETTPSKKALLFSSFLSKAFSTDSTLFPKAIISELLFKISVIASTNNSNPLLSISFYFLLNFLLYIIIVPRSIVSTMHIGI